MLPEEKQKHILRARAVLKNVRIVSLATVSPNSTPHNSPVFIAFDRDYNAIWTSHPSAQHSQNITRMGEVFIAVYDSAAEISTGLYVDASASIVEADDPDFGSAFAIFAAAKQAAGSAVPTQEDFARKDGQRLYCAVPNQLWINHASKNGQGIVIRDQRFRVTAATLQNSNEYLNLETK